MKTVQDMMTVTVAISVNARAADPEAGGQPFLDNHAFCLGADEADRDELVRTLVDLAEAIGEDQLYGWMTQRCLQLRIDAGEIVEAGPPGATAP